MLSPHIVSDPENNNGMPTVVGTRTPVCQVLWLLGEGKSLRQIQTDLVLSGEEIQECVAYGVRTSKLALPGDDGDPLSVPERKSE